jgi:hypothetical protein
MNLAADVIRLIEDLQSLHADLLRLNAPKPTGKFFTFEMTGLSKPVRVDYYYEPAEAPTGPSYSCGGTPGCDAQVTINAVWLLGVDISGIISEELFNDIEQAAFSDAEDWE